MTHPNEIASNLIQLSRELDAGVRQLRELDRRAVDAECEHEVAFARAFLSAEGSVEARKYTATIAVKDEKHASLIAGQLVRSQREAIRAIQTRIEVGRTLSATVRSEIALAGVGGA
jgi:hypothetical protein